MGGSLSDPSSIKPLEKKKIVIIGASFGGNILTNMLKQIDPEEKHLDILLIDKYERFE